MHGIQTLKFDLFWTVSGLKFFGLSKLPIFSLSLEQIIQNFRTSVHFSNEEIYEFPVKRYEIIILS